ncbi:hypothetical protein ACFL0F_00825 [Patescibacteria group bacterium]
MDKFDHWSRSRLEKEIIERGFDPKKIAAGKQNDESDLQAMRRFIREDNQRLDEEKALRELVALEIEGQINEMLNIVNDRSNEQNLKAKTREEQYSGRFRSNLKAIDSLRSRLNKVTEDAHRRMDDISNTASGEKDRLDQTCELLSVLEGKIKTLDELKKLLEATKDDLASTDRIANNINRQQDEIGDILSSIRKDMADAQIVATCPYEDCVNADSSNDGAITAAIRALRIESGLSGFDVSSMQHTVNEHTRSIGENEAGIGSLNQKVTEIQNNLPGNNNQDTNDTEEDMEIKEVVRDRIPWWIWTVLIVLILAILAGCCLVTVAGTLYASDYLEQDAEAAAIVETPVLEGIDVVPPEDEGVEANVEVNIPDLQDETGVKSDPPEEESLQLPDKPAVSSGSCPQASNLGPWAPSGVGENFEVTCNETVCRATHVQLWWPGGSGQDWGDKEISVIVPPGLSIDVLNGGGKGWEYALSCSMDEINRQVQADHERRKTDTDFYGEVDVDFLIEKRLAKVRFDRR